MSTIREAVLEAIDGGARNNAAIRDATGFEAAQVSSQLFHLKSSGVIVKSEDGYLRTESTPEPKSRVHGAPEPEGSPPPAAKKGRRTRKVKRQVRAAKAVPKKSAPKPKPNGGNGTAHFARFGEFVVVRHSDLVELFAMVDRWRKVIER